MVGEMRDRSGFRSGMLVLVAVLATGCRSMTTAQFVNDRLAQDKGFRSLARAASLRADAFHKIADTPIDDIPASAERLGEIIVQARDNYRKAKTYRINLGNPRIDREGMRLKDDDDPKAGRVLIDGTGITLVTTVGEDYVTMLRIETNRGLEILTFDETMLPSPTREFDPYLDGDVVLPDLNQLLLLRRLNNPPGTSPYAPGMKQCPACRGSTDADARFCILCGAPQQNSPGERSLCVSCGAQLTAGAKFCPGCGASR